MRWMTLPLTAAVVSCVLWVAPVSARVEKTAKTAVAAKVAHPAKSAPSAKSGKAAQKPASSKAAKAGKNSKNTQKAALKSKSQKSAQKSSKSRLAASSKKSRSAKRTAAAAAVTDDAVEQQTVAAIDPNDSASERVYDGMLPTAEEKIVMPVVKDQNGRAECVQLIKSLMDAPRTMFWKEGRKLKASWDKIQPGTAIATFIKGRYPQKGKGPGNKHAAIFLRATSGGIYVFDQFAGQSDAEERFIPWHHPRDKRPSNNATAFSTVRW